MKVRIRFRKKLPLENVFFFVAMFCVVTYALLEHVSIPIPVYSSVKMPLLYLGGLCILTQFNGLSRVLMKRKYFFVLLMLLLFCTGALASAYFNRVPTIGSNPMKYTIRLMLYVVELFLLMIWTSERGCSRFVLNFIFYYLLIVTAVSDLLMFSGLIVFKTGNIQCFLVGSKFTVAYFHINLLTFWFIKSRETLFSNRRIKFIAIVGIPFIWFVSYYVDCITGIFGCVIMIILLRFINSRKQKTLLKLSSHVVMLSTMAASAIFPFVAGVIVSVPFVRHILLNIVNRSTNLTGRLNIYVDFVDGMHGHWLWGYGMGNANTTASRLFGYANVQNAMLQWVLQLGVVGTVCMVALMITVLWRLNKSNAVARSMPLICLIYLYIILGMIEITYSMSFLLLFGLLFLFSADAAVSQGRADGIAWRAQR